MRLATTALGVIGGLLVGVGGVPEGPAAPAAPQDRPPFSSRVLTTGLDNPWEITEGPDGFLWVTEKTAGRVTRVRPADGAKRTAATIAEVVATPGTQDGLLGLALHPRLLRDPATPFVYAAYTYDANPDPAVLDRRAKIARLSYDERTETLDHRVDLITGLPASTDHNSGRLTIGPDGKLYYTIGDQGNNQFDRACLPIRAQALPTAADLRAGDRSAYMGKVLRLDLDGSVPADNPVLRGVRSHVYSYGHRNAQGLAFARTGRLYSSEQGPKTDDEVNLIRAGGNYGWPRVAGFRDDQAYRYANWSASRTVPCESLAYSDYDIPPSVPTVPETTFRHPRFVPPLATFHTVPTGFDFRDPRCAENEWYFICWPTTAPSSLDVYEADQPIAGHRRALLMPSLKDGTVFLLPLTADGTAVATDPVPLFKTVNRYRDTAIGPDGRTIYVATDRGGLTRDRAGRPTTALENPGAILEFTYTG